MTQKPTVLLAAADPDVLRALIGEFPRSAGWLTMAARAANQVPTALAKRQPDVAVVHHALDDMSGLALCAWLGKHSASTLRILWTKDIATSPRIGDPYEATLRHPCPTGMVAELAVKELRERYASQATERFIAEVTTRHQAMDAQSYYELLGLPPEQTNQLSLRNTYDRFSMAFHPDRHMHLRNTPSYDLLVGYYKRIGEAYRILDDPEKRSRYDRDLANGQLRYDDTVREKSGPRSIEDLSENPKARRFLSLAQQSLANGRFSTAVQNLKFALSMDSGNVDIQDKIAEIEALL